MVVRMPTLDNLWLQKCFHQHMIYINWPAPALASCKEATKESQGEDLLQINQLENEPRNNGHDN